MRQFFLNFIYQTLQMLGICAVFPTETITTAKMFHAAIIMAWTSGTTGRVISCKVKDGDEWLEIRGQTIQRIVDLIKVGEGIELDVTLDEIADYDAATVKGKQAAITLKQISAGDNTKMALLTINKGVVDNVTVDMDALGKKVSTMGLRIRAYHETPGTALYTFDPAATAA